MGLLGKEPGSICAPGGCWRWGRRQCVCLIALTWGGFSPLPLSDWLSCSSYTSPADFFSQPFILSEMSVCSSLPTPSHHSPRGHEPQAKETVQAYCCHLGKGSSRDEDLIISRGREGGTSIPSLFPRNEGSLERRESSLVVFAFGWYT